MTNTAGTQIKQLAEDTGVSESCLKAVYFRGVREFIDSGATEGSATMHGLERIAKFIADPSRSDDDDFLIASALDVEQNSMTFDIESDAVLVSATYGDGTDIASLFSPGVTTSITCSAEQLEVSGYLDSFTWDYQLSIATGDAKLSVQ